MSQVIDTLEENLETTDVWEAETETTPVKSNGSPASKSEQPRGVSLSRRIWVVLATALATVVGLSWWLYARQFESTDDAQIEGHIDVVSSRIPGTVVYVNPKVQNNQYVEAGTLLAELDPTDYKAAVDHAKADLATREAAAHSAEINVPITDANAFSQLNLAQAALQEALATVESEEANLAAAQHKVKQDEALYTRAERDRIRWQQLADEGVFSRSDADAHEAEALADAQTIETDRALVAAIQQRIAAAHSLVEQRRAQVLAAHTAPQQVSNARTQVDASIGQVAQAKADVHTAELNVGYAKIYAPVSGIIGRKTVELGQRIQPGQSLLAVVPVDDIWVTANFKETQLKRMQAGQPVMVHVDTFDRDYEGTVENLPGAAGTLFSLLPPENASGNYVKVVQRLPIRIRINPGQDPKHALRPGMSAEPSVKVR
jgi:membrane fusion protein, multidrug efflux system